MSQEAPPVRKNARGSITAHITKYCLPFCQIKTIFVVRKEATNIVIKQIYQEWKERRKARIEECRNWMPEPYRITPEELEEINQLLEEMDKMDQRGGRGSRGR